MARARFFRGSGWLQAAFTSIAFLVASCTDDEMPGVDEPISGESEKRPAEQGAAELPFPTANTAFEIRTLLYSHAQPPGEGLNTCFDSVQSDAEKAMNAQSMGEAREAVEQRMKDQETTYHWCFFQLLHRVDLKLEEVDTPLVAKSDFFLKKMKEIWILATALDQHFSSTNYYGFARDRYLRINRQYFGRDLINTFPPFGDGMSLPQSRPGPEP